MKISLSRALLMFIAVLLFSTFAQSRAGATVAQSELITASTTVANYMEEYRRLPDAVTIGPAVLSTSEYLYLAARSIHDISQNINNGAYTIPNVLNPVEPYPAIILNDAFYKAPLSKSTYLALADSIISVLEANSQTPDYFTFNSADIRFCEAVHYLSTILRAQDFLSSLPHSMDIKIISPKNLVPAEWATPAGFETYTSAITSNMYSNEKVYYDHNVVDYSTFKLAKEVAVGSTMYDAMESIYNWVVFDTWLDWNSSFHIFTPFLNPSETSTQTAREAFYVRSSQSGGHNNIKMNALYRTLGFPGSGQCVYYYPEQRWLFSDVHFWDFPFGMVPPYPNNCTDIYNRPLPSKADDFIGEINYLSGYSTVNPAPVLQFNGLFVTGADVVEYGADSIVNKAKAGGFNVIVMTAKTAYGNLFYNPGAYTPAEYSSRIKADALASLVTAAHANNIKVHIGYEVFADTLTLTQHYNWAQADYNYIYAGAGSLVSPCEASYKNLVKSLLEGALRLYDIDGVVLMDVRWLEGRLWDNSPEMGHESQCDPYRINPGWYEQILTDYTQELVTWIKGIKSTSHVSLLGVPIGRPISNAPWCDIETGICHTVDNRNMGQDYAALAGLVDNFIVVADGYYWFDDSYNYNDINNYYRYDFEHFVANLKTQTTKPVSIAFNLRDEWEYPANFFTGLQNYSKDKGLSGFYLFSLVSGWGDWGSAFSESQWDKIQYMTLTHNELDMDGDGYITPWDCNDNDAAIHPWAAEICNGIDENCSGAADEGFAGIDLDHDGYTCSLDCNDSDPTVNPGAAKICDGKDNNCDGSKDFATDEDKDHDGVMWCANDCDDNNPARFPGNTEICDGIDNDCNSGKLSTETDPDKDGYFLCGTNQDCNDNNFSMNPGLPELCGDGKDNNCNGSVDEQPCDCNADQDGYTSTSCGGTDCNDLNATINPGGQELCGDTLDSDCDGRINNCPGCTDADHDGKNIEGGTCGSIDCNDADSTIYPGATRLCDGKDNNCDGLKDFTTDEDKDGDGELWCAGDCNDNNSMRSHLNPETLSATGTCGDSVDNDCDSKIDGVDPGCR